MEQNFLFQHLQFRLYVFYKLDVPFLTYFCSIFQNPFDTYTIKPDAATGIREKYPILIPATENSRMVGCLCEYDYEEVVWFKLDKGKVSQCECGYYFKLIEHDPLDMGVSPKFGKGQGSGMKAIV